MPGRKPVRFPGQISNPTRQEYEGIRSPLIKALYFEASASEFTRSSIYKRIGTLPRNSLVVMPTVVNILERFNGDNIYIKLGTHGNIASLGKIISHNTGVFNLYTPGFGTRPSDYGVIFKEPKDIVLSVIAEIPSTSGVSVTGSCFGILFYLDMAEVEGYNGV